MNNTLFLFSWKMLKWEMAHEVSLSSKYFKTVNLPIIAFYFIIEEINCNYIIIRSKKMELKSLYFGTFNFIQGEVRNSPGARETTELNSLNKLMKVVFNISVDSKSSSMLCIEIFCRNFLNFLNINLCLVLSNINWTQLIAIEIELYTTLFLLLQATVKYPDNIDLNYFFTDNFSHPQLVTWLQVCFFTNKSFDKNQQIYYWTLLNIHRQEE